MLLSIIIVNYRSASLILDCLRSVQQFNSGLNYEVIVVDNNSNDGNEDLLLKSFPGLHWIQMGYNAGFARANNVGIKQVKGEVVLLLNPDTLAIDDSIVSCYHQLVQSKAVAAGVKLLNFDRSEQISGNYAMKGGLNYLLPLPFLGKLVKGLGEAIKVKKPHITASTGTTEVDWINGAFLMVKKSAIDKAGLLDEDFFLYAEEAEWCSRLKKVGKLCIFHNCQIIHLQGETANETFQSEGKGYYNLFDKKGLQIIVSNFVRIRKEFGLGWFFMMLLGYWIEVPIFFLGVLLTRLFAKNTYSFKHVKGYCKNVWRLTSLSRTIIPNRPYFYKVL